MIVMARSVFPSFDSDAFAVQKFAEALSLTVQAFARTSSQSESSDSNNNEKLTVFDSSVIPPVTIEAYVGRLHKHFLCSDKCFLAALVYIDRLLRFGKIRALTARNVHRIALTSLLSAVKFLEDGFYSNSYYAKCGGITLKELNRLERVFLRKVEFQLYISDTEYRVYEGAVESMGACEDNEETPVEDEDPHETKRSEMQADVSMGERCILAEVLSTSTKQISDMMTSSLKDMAGECTPQTIPATPSTSSGKSEPLFGEDSSVVSFA